MQTESLATVKANLSKFVDEVEATHERVTITRKGRPTAVLMSVEDLEGLLETLEVLSTPGEVEAIREGEAAAAAGEVHTLEQVRADLAARTSPAGG
jgi:antitoxin YefM